MIFNNKNSKFEILIDRMSGQVSRFAFFQINKSSIFFYVASLLMLISCTYNVFEQYQLIHACGLHNVLNGMSIADWIALFFPIIFITIFFLFSKVLIPGLIRIALDPMWLLTAVTRVKKSPKLKPASHFPLVPKSPPRRSILA